MIVQDGEWQEIRTWFLGLGWDEDDIDMIEVHRQNKPLYTDHQTALAMVARLDECVIRYGVSWPLLPDLKMLITACLTERALEQLRISELVQDLSTQYRQEVLFSKHGAEVISARQSKAGSKTREDRTANSKKPSIVAAIKEELPSWTRDSAARLARRLGVSATHIRRVRKEIEK
ncbi:hypothetical protein [Aeromonas hydrophila]|uniref:hypothetical protein n=1 Tax=Aeromonas hydrophila TaxID=644 RepID=UPI00107F31F1|nr:hypothetical protein [Aeromonas hydrophila]QPR87250.1 hypothetical protein I6G73_17520 [Aeromonas hydrophila]UON52354.1 hypothetical protein IUJ49_16670 [Aeromonas hydrophila]